MHSYVSTPVNLRVHTHVEPARQAYVQARSHLQTQDLVCPPVRANLHVHEP